MNQAQNAGNTALFTCQVTGEPVPTVRWFLNDALVDNSNTMKYAISTMQLNINTIVNTLTITSVELSDVGTYTCNATNAISSDVSSGILSINGEYIIINLLSCAYVTTILYFIAVNNLYVAAPMDGQQFNITEGTNGSITCTATGYPVPTVLWQNSDGSSFSSNRLVSGSPVISSTVVGNVSSVSVELMVIGALRVDTGMYRCLADNGVNNTTRNVIITVQCKFIL